MRSVRSGDGGIRWNYAFLPINPKRMRATLIPPTTPETCPISLMNSTGSVELLAMGVMKRKKPAASTRKMKPVITNRQFRCRMMNSLNE